MAEAGFVTCVCLARGTDTASHRGVLNGVGKIVVVPSCGLDRNYSYGNKCLYQKIIEQAAMLTEYAPGTEPLPMSPAAIAS
jgi:DNA processing protein